MKILFKLLLLLLVINIKIVRSQENLYNPEIDGVIQLKEAIEKAKKEKKFVFVQVGGNWCPWCKKFYDFCSSVIEIDTMIKNNFVVVFLNYSKQNKNLNAMKMLDNPHRFGFPVIVILDSNGKRLHTQDTALLEKNNSYDTLKVKRFISLWTPYGIHPKTK